MFHFQDGDPATIVPMAGVSESYCFTRSWLIVQNTHRNEQELKMNLELNNV